MAKTTKTKLVNFKLIEGNKDISTQIASIQRRGKKLEKDIHVLACSIVSHIYKHRECSLANKMAEQLVQAMPRFSRANALRDFFETYAPVVYNEKEQALVFVKEKADAVEDVDSVVKAAMNNPFYVKTPEQKYVPLDLRKSFETLLARAEKRVADGIKDGVDNVDTTLLEKLREVNISLEDVA
jgi:hypothetical protein